MTARELIVRYEDPGLLVVDKPAGVHTAPLRPGETGTLIDMVIRSYPEVAAIPGIKPVETGPRAPAGQGHLRTGGDRADG